jgi:hypothetical protein
VRYASSLSVDAQGQRPSAAGLTPHVWIAEVNNLFRGRVEVINNLRREPMQFTRRADSD